MILDSGPLLAALDRRDRHHKLASGILRQARGRALVPDAVIVEVDIVARRWLGPPAALGFLEAIRTGVHTRVVLDDALWQRAVAIDAAHPDLDLGLVDGAVMAVAEERRLPIFTFDFRRFRAVRGPEEGEWHLVVQEADLR